VRLLGECRSNAGFNTNIACTQPSAARWLQPRNNFPVSGMVEKSLGGRSFDMASTA
jgi:hypothetical protein